ncbi:MAG TPA: hypothetical protein VME21_03070 [Steroidobacteraceae bacterium]|nr:hypothetical protein [Steroidobacteraceae bacterium]
MSELLIAIAANVLVGVIAVALLLRRRSHPQRHLPLDQRSAPQIFQSQVPDAVATLVACAADAALFDLQGGGVGLVQRHGHRWNARVLQAGSIAALQVHEPATLELRFSDYAAPRLRLRIDDPAERQLWLQRLRAAAQRAPTGLRGGLSHA